MMRVTFAELGPAEFRSGIGRFVAVYTAAMNPPQRMLTGRDAILDRHAANPGFRALAALLLAQGDDPLEPPAARPIFDRIGRALLARGDDLPPHAGAGRLRRAGATVVGFTYGFHGVPGQWWHDMVAGALAQGAGRAAADGGGRPGWLDDSFEVAELHVLPDCQGMGIGRELLLRLTADRPEHTAVLSTADTESRARRLYRGVGFTDLLTGFRFAGGEPPYAVMGAALPLRSARSPRPSSS